MPALPRSSSKIVTLLTDLALESEPEIQLNFHQYEKPIKLSPMKQDPPLAQDEYRDIDEQTVNEQEGKETRMNRIRF